MPNPEHLYILRRQLLRAVDTAFPGVLDEQELLDGVPLAAGATARAEALDELRNLLAWGYLENAKHAADPWYRITGAGRDQYRQNTLTLDHRVWGRRAV